VLLSWLSFKAGGEEKLRMVVDYRALANKKNTRHSEKNRYPMPPVGWFT
jgi:hypothetical protein